MCIEIDYKIIVRERAYREKMNSRYEGRDAIRENLYFKYGGRTVQIQGQERYRPPYVN